MRFWTRHRDTGFPRTAARATNTSLLVLALVIVDPPLAVAQEAHSLRGSEVPQYIVVSAFLSHVQLLTDGEGADQERFARFLNDLGVDSDDPAIGDLLLAVQARQAAYDSPPPDLERRPAETSEITRRRAQYVAQEVGIAFGRFLATLHRSGGSPEAFQKGIRSYFVAHSGLALTTSDPRFSKDLEHHFDAGVEIGKGQAR